MQDLTHSHKTTSHTNIETPMAVTTLTIKGIIFIDMMFLGEVTNTIYQHGSE